jgi:predicted  nucleic acid-binding Zn-ribbon protein
MISVTGATNYYSLQPALLEKHSRTLSWLSATMHWKSELAFYQKTLNDLRPSMTSGEFKAEIEDLENQVLYFLLEGIEEMRKKLRNHESRLARMLEARAEWDTQYYKEHDALMESATSLAQNIDKLVDALRERLKKHVHH